MDDPTNWVSKYNDIDIEKHRTDRADHGFSFHDWINFDSYLSWVIIQGLTKFRNEGAGYPANLTQESWNDMLDKMIAAFEAHGRKFDYSRTAEEREADNIVWAEGSQLFIDRFGSLWD